MTSEVYSVKIRWTVMRFADLLYQRVLRNPFVLPTDTCHLPHPTTLLSVYTSSRFVYVFHEIRTELTPYKGACKFGNGCKKQHPPREDTVTWRPNDDVPRTDSFLGHKGPIATQTFPPPTANNKPHVPASIVLPRPSPDTADLIPLNKDGLRLDFYLQPPSNTSWSAYQSRKGQQKPCNDFQLNGYCKNAADCVYDHTELTDDLKHVLKTIVHDYPCGRKGNCRLKNCHLGHICYRPDCRGSSGKGGCRLNRPMHSMDPNVAQWVPAEATTTKHGSHSKESSIGAWQEQQSEHGGYEVESEASTPFTEDKNSPPPYAEPSYPDELD